jgi:hypothetical protein
MCSAERWDSGESEDMFSVGLEDDFEVSTTLQEALCHLLHLTGCHKCTAMEKSIGVFAGTTGVVNMVLKTIGNQPLGEEMLQELRKTCQRISSQKQVLDDLHAVLQGNELRDGTIKASVLIERVLEALKLDLPQHREEVLIKSFTDQIDAHFEARCATAAEAFSNAFQSSRGLMQGPALLPALQMHVHVHVHIHIDVGVDVDLDADVDVDGGVHVRVHVHAANERHVRAHKHIHLQIQIIYKHIYIYMHMCMLYMYICLPLCIYISICICIYIYIHIYIYTYVHIYTYTYISLYIYYIYIYIIYIYICRCTYVHMRIHMHI